MSSACPVIVSFTLGRCAKRTSLVLACLLVAMSYFAGDLPAQEPETKLTGHGAAVNAAVYSPDGSVIATAGSDQLIKLWNATTHREIRTLQGHTAQVLSLAISGDNRTLVSGGADNSIREWDVPRDDPVHRFEGHPDAVTNVVVAPNDRTALSTGVDHSLRQWDLESLKIMAIWEGHEAAVRRIAYRPDNNSVASGDDSGNVILWNVLTGKPLVRFGAHAEPISGLAYHSNNQQLFSSGADGLLQTWQLPIRSPLMFEPFQAPPADVVLNSNSQLGVTAAGEVVQIHTLASGEVQRTLEGLPAVASSVAISPNDATLAVAHAGGGVQFWTVANGEDAGRVNGHPTGVTDVAWHPDNARVATAGEDGTVRLWQRPPADVPLAGHASQVLALATDPRNPIVATGSADNIVRLLNAQTGQPIRQLAGHTAPVCLVKLGTEAASVVSADTSGEVRLWQTADGTETARWGAHDQPVTAAAVAADGTFLFTAGEDGSVKHWPLPSPQPQALAGHTASVSAVAMAPDASQFVTGGQDQTVRVFAAADGQLLRQLEGQAAPVTSLAWIAREETSSLVASGGEDGAVRFWHVDTGTAWKGPENEPTGPDVAPIPAPPLLRGHTGAVSQIDIDPLSGRVATSGADGTVRIWQLPSAPELLATGLGPVSPPVASPDRTWFAVTGTLQEKPAVFLYEAGSGRRVHTLLGHKAPITSLAFSVDNSRLVTGSSDKTVRVWDLKDPKFAQLRTLDLPQAVTAVAFSSDAQTVYAASTDNIIRQWIWDSPAAENVDPEVLVEDLATFSGHTAAIARLVVRGDLLISAGADSTIRMWNAKTQAIVRSLNHGSPVGALVATQDASILASAAADNSIKLWNGSDGSLRATLTGHPSAVQALSLSHGDSLLASSSAEGLRLWDLAGGMLLQAWDTPDWPVTGVAFGPAPDEELATSPIHHQLIVVGGTGELRLYRPDLLHWLAAHRDSVNGDPNNDANLPRGAIGVQWLGGREMENDGRAEGKLVSAGANGEVKLWDLSLEAEKQHIGSLAGTEAGLFGLAASDDGQWVAASEATGELLLWSLADLPAANQSVPTFATLTLPAAVHALHFNADGSRLGLVREDQVVDVYDVKRQCLLQRFLGHTAPVISAAFDERGEVLLTGSADNTARAWSVSATIVQYKPDAIIRDLALTADNSILIAAGDTPRLTLWPVASNEAAEPDASSTELAKQSAVGEPVLLPAMDETPETWEEVAALEVVVHPTLSQIAVLDERHRVTRWDLAARTIIDVIEPPAAPTPDATKEAGAEEGAEETPLGSAPGRLSYDPTGEWLAIGLAQSVRVLDVVSGRQLEVLSAGTEITAASFTPEARLVIARKVPANEPTGVPVSLRTRALRKWWVAHEARVNSVAFTPDGSKLLTAGRDAVARLWNLEDTSLVRSFGAPGETTLRDATVTPDGQSLVAVTDNQQVLVWPVASSGDTESPMEVMPHSDVLQHPSAVTRIDVSADSTRLLSGDAAGTLRLWDLRYGKVIQVWKPHEQSVSAVALGADNSTILSGSIDMSAATMKAAVASTLSTGEPIEEFVLFNNNTQVATSAGPTVRFWNLADQQMIRQFDLESPVTAFAVRGDNAQLVVAESAERLSIFSVADGQLLTSFTIEAAVHELKYAADGLKIVAAMADGGLRFYSPEDGRLLYELKSDQPLSSAQFTSDSRRVISGGEQGSVELWSYASPEAIRVFNGHGGNVYAVAYSPDGTRIASCSADQTVRIWDAKTGTQLKQLSGHQGPVYSVAFSPDGALVVSCGADNSLRLWDAVGGRQLKQLVAGEASLYSVAFHPQGRLVASAGLDKKVYVHDVLAGSLQTMLEGHDDYVYRVRYNQDGSRLLSCGYGGNIIVWNVANGQPLLRTTAGLVANYADYSPHDDEVVVAGGDGAARLVDVELDAK